MSFNPNQKTEVIRPINSQFDQESPSSDNEESCSYHNHTNSEQQKYYQYTTYQVEQQPKYLKVDVYEVYKKLKPEIINKIKELTTEVDCHKNNNSLMSKGNGVQKFIDCLEHQEQSKQHFFQQILFDLRKQIFLYSHKTYLNQIDLDNLQDNFDQQFDRDFKKMKCFIKNLLNWDYLILTEQTNECKLACQKVHAYQKRVPEQIPSIIEEILQEPNIQANNTIRKIQAQARKVKPFIKKCFKPNSKDESKKVLQMMQLKQKLTSNQLKKFMKLITLLKKNQHFLKFRDQNFSEEDIKDILDKFNNHINTMIKNKFYTMNGRSKKIQKKKNNSKIP